MAVPVRRRGALPSDADDVVADFDTAGGSQFREEMARDQVHRGVGHEFDAQAGATEVVVPARRRHQGRRDLR